MNFSYGIIGIVGVLAAISIGFIAMDPTDIIEPRVEENLVACTMQWDPMCGVDGETYGNMCDLNTADVKLDYSGECVILEPTPETTFASLPMTAIVSVPAGVAIPGCNDTNECYLPYEINVAIGATVTWINDDSAAHTVTSGIVYDASSVFDSSLFMAGNVFEFTFDEAGTYDYFCMVHPWMTGIVNVQ